MMCRLILTVILCAATLQARALANTDKADVCINGQCVTAEIAETDAARAAGLMHRDELSPGRGMLFVFPEEARHSFWMMNMRFPIDMVWIGKNLRIVDIRHNAQPCSRGCPSYAPDGAAAYVLEIPAGFCRRYRISIGDPVTIAMAEK
ncbi:MAG TPA: DUF192 domain-containing protein [Candidatus Omnitrophota bacterium]|nr:DUF192 domain-containing protein [Candidatus Omnitrophota bacterium]